MNRVPTQLYKIELVSPGCEHKILLWYTNQETMFKWRKLLIQATGDLKIKDYYDETSTVLGQGSRCTVIKGTNRISKLEVAIKRIDKEKCSKDVLDKIE